MPSTWWWLALALLAARLGALLWSVRQPFPVTGDEPVYEELAANLLAGRGYFSHGVPWVWKPPGWPLVLAGLHALLGPGRPGIVFAQGLFDGGTALLAGWTAWRITGARVPGAIAFLLAALWPPFFRESRYMQTEPLFTLCGTAAVAAFTRYALTPTVRRAFLVGLLAGVASLVRPNGLAAVGGVVLGWLFYRRRELAAEARPLAALALGALLLVGPWTIRNAVVFHTFIPVSIGGGELLFMGLTPETDGRWDPAVWDRIKDPMFAAEEARLGHKLDRIEIDNLFLREGLARWRHDPGNSLALSVKRVARLCFVPIASSDRPLVRVGFLATLLALYVLAVPAGVAGLRAPDRAGAMAGALLVALVVNVAALSVFYTNSRYFEPMRPQVMILAAITLGRLPAFRRRAG